MILKKKARTVCTPSRAYAAQEKDHAMKRYTQKTGRSQYILACILGLLAITAGGISLSMNVMFGVKTGIVMAAIFALSDGAKIIMPMVDAALGGTNLKRRLAYGLAVVVSIGAATSYLLETQTARLQAVQHKAQAQLGLKHDIARIRTALASIKEPQDVLTLRRLVSSKGEAAQRESRRGSCGPVCEGLKREQAVLTARLGQAVRREKLEKELKAKVDRAESNSTAALGSADTIAALTGIDRELAAQREGLAKSMLMLAILELLAMFSGDAGRLFVATYRARKIAQAKETVPDKKQNTETKPAQKRPGRRTRISRDEAFRLLCESAVDGTVVGSNTSIARMLNVPVSTVGDIEKGWLTQWAKEGKITIEVRRRGKTVLQVAS